MANLKADLLNELRNAKYYEEHELARLAQDPNTNYKEKIDDIVAQLKTIALINQSLGLTEVYFKEPVEPVEPVAPVVNYPEPDAKPATEEVPTVIAQPGKPLPGQSHGE